MAGAQSSARAAVFRSALLFTPFFALALLGFVVIVRDAAQQGLSAGRVVGLVLVGSVVLLLAYQVVQSVRDVFSGLIETVGLVERQWSRNEFLLFRNTYIFVGKDVYRLSPEQGIQVERGKMVRIVHLPHTSTVETIDVVRQESGASAG